jgi:uncharacterized protein YhbP (UPF0306 family)
MNIDIEKTIREYLPQIMHMSLATTNDGKPWVCEVHFAYDDVLNIYFRSLTSRRHSQEIADNANVAGNMVTQHFLGQPVRAVYFEGTAKLLEVGEEQTKAFEVFSERLHLDEGLLEEARRPDGHQFYKITVDTFYLFDSYTSKPSQKYELKWEGDKK